MAQFTPCQKATLSLTGGLLVIAIIFPFALPPIVELVKPFALSTNVISNGNRIEITVKSNDSCKFSLGKKIFLNDQPFMYCQLAALVNATTAQKLCKTMNSRFVDERYNLLFTTRKKAYLNFAKIVNASRITACHLYPLGENMYPRGPERWL